MSLVRKSGKFLDELSPFPVGAGAVMLSEILAGSMTRFTISFELCQSNSVGWGA